ncbi:transcription factor RFX4-like [Diadema antillarum]|uniref:transcription factor RFX4-like n=1 Tax=Diadema antillarum TaxID=105358 RepID=UPI003A85C503
MDAADSTADVISRALSRPEVGLPHSTSKTLVWLEENYELADGVCIPRNALYVHYTDFCRKTNTIPINAASFGKIIRQQFPQVTTRRLGTRGQSKYHYYGIAVRVSSVYYDATFSRKAQTSDVKESTKKEPPKQTVSYSPRTKLGSLLPKFPDVSTINLPSEINKESVSTFLVMYRTHCQRIVDTVIRASFDEVQHYLLHFWQGMPTHILPILESDSVARIVGICDIILYKTVSSVLVPSALQPLPESLSHVIRWFAGELHSWLERALDKLPQGLKIVKFTEAERFSSLMGKQMSLNHLAQAARSVTQASDVILQMADDWTFLDLDGICRQTVAMTTSRDPAKRYNAIMNLCDDFEKVLDDDVTLEKLIGWLDRLLDTYVTKPGSNLSDNAANLTRKFLLTWSIMSTKVMRDLTLNSAPSFGSFHVLHLVLEEYLLYKSDLILAEWRVNMSLRHLQGAPVEGELEDLWVGPRRGAHAPHEVLPLSPRGVANHASLSSTNENAARAAGFSYWSRVQTSDGSSTDVNRTHYAVYQQQQHDFQYGPYEHAHRERQLSSNAWKGFEHHHVGIMSAGSIIHPYGPNQHQHHGSPAPQHAFATTQLTHY